MDPGVRQDDLIEGNPSPTMLSSSPPSAASSAEPEDRFFDSNGVRIRYVEQGHGDPLILLHSYTGDLDEAWRATGVLPQLAKKYRVIALDARGHGKSGKPYDPKQYGPEMGLDIVRLMDHLGIGRAHILGYSMGAHIVAQLVTLNPERFCTMILGGASGRRNWTADEDKRAEGEAAEMDQALLTTQILRLWPKGEPNPDAAKLRELSAQRLAGKDPQALAAVRRSNRDQVVTQARMAAVKVPTLGIVGTADPYMKDFNELKRVMPQMKLLLIEGASHVNATRRPEFVKAVEEFLAVHPLNGA
jgi:pimeloyl-ACP methyl ester carboxylesterase